MRIGRGWAIAVGAVLAVTLMLAAFARSAWGDAARQDRPPEPLIAMRNRPAEYPMRSGPHSLGGGNYRIDWFAADITRLSECGTRVSFVPVSGGRRADVDLGQTPAGRSRTDSIVARGISRGDYTIAVRSGCEEWFLTISRQ